MINLTQYGFTILSTTDTYTEYIGHGFRVTIFDYTYTLGNKDVFLRQSLLISTKEFSDASIPFEDLEKWLKKNKIKKLS